MTQQHQRDWDRWLELTDEEALGDAVDESEAEFVQRYAESDERCAEDRALWAAIEQHVRREPVPAADDAYTVQAVLEQMGHEAAPRRSRARWWAMGVIAAAAAVLLAWPVMRPTEVPDAPAVAAPEPVPGLVVQVGRVIVGDVEIGEGEPIPEGTMQAAGARACVAEAGWGSACLEPDARVSVARDEAGRPAVALERGEIEVDLHADGVVAAADAVRVEGTRFRIAVGEVEAAVVVTAVAGSVHVVGPQGELRADAGHAVEVMLERVERPARDEPSGSKARLGPAAVLERAQAARGAGNVREAASLYRKLLARHPRSAEASVAWLSLGELELDSLGNPAAALRAYDNYLRRGGPLAREARFHRIRALRKLGDPTKEAAAIADFLQRHPRSVYAPALRKRQRALAP